ncbi:MAG: N-6 DNA methylase [Bifidobacteriaceae bacterium]|jgi:hypothetical protein|nr:N-6 DNA methylase [Bifidobacteriaceae bacterium]
MTTRRLPLAQVAEIRDEACEHVSLAELKQRAGQFRYLGEQSGYAPFDDYRIEGCHLVIGAFCNIKSPQGAFSTLLTRQRITPSDIYHVLRCERAADTRYLRHVLANTPAGPYLTGPAVAERLEVGHLRGVMAPWPSRAQRLAFLRAMDLLEQELRRAPEQADAVLEVGDDLFAKWFGQGRGTVRLGDLAQLRPGRFSPLDAAFDPERSPVLGAGGVIGSTAEAHTAGPSLVVGRSGAALVAYYRARPAAVGARLVYCQEADAAAPLPYVFFALRRAGAASSPGELRRRAGGGQAAAGDLGELRLAAAPGQAEAQAWAEAVRPLLAQLDTLERRLWCLREYRRLLWHWLVESADEQPLPKSPAAPETPETRETPEYPETPETRETPENPARRAPAPAGEPGQAPGPLPGAAPDAAAPVGGPAAPIGSAGPALAGLYEALGDQLARLGPRPAAEDLVWEFVPLAFLRLRLGAAGFARLAARVGAGDGEPPAAALDAALGALAEAAGEIGFLKQLGYGDSLLNAAQLAGCVQFLDGLDGAALNAAALANLYARQAPGPAAAPPAPPAISDLVAGLAACGRDAAGAAGQTTVVDLCAGAGELAVAALGGWAGGAPAQVSLAAFAGSFADSLFLRLICFHQGVGARVEVGSALTSPLPAAKAQLVVGFPPPGQQAWTDGAADQADGRWPFGAPPPGRAGYAWIQQAIAVMDKSATAVLLLRNSVLQTEAAGEAPLRVALARSGWLSAVIALPGRVFARDVPPLSVVVLDRGSRRPAESVLFIDAQTLGQDLAHPAGLRLLPAAVVGRVIGAYRRHRGGEAVDEGGFARTIGLPAIEGAGHRLTPWTYLAPPPDSAPGGAAGAGPASPVERLRALRAERLEAGAELAGYLKALAAAG